MESNADKVRSFLLALLLHVLAIGLAWISARWVWPQPDLAAAGEPIQATLRVSSADVRRVQQAIQASPKPPVESAAPTPQPKPSPSPQDSDTPLQPKPQAPQDQPDTVDQQEITRNALLKAEQEAREQEARRRQEQVDLTEEIERQNEAERRQRLRAQQLEQLEAIKRERELAARQTRMEEQRLKQLADLQAAPANAARTPAPQAGARGVDEGLRARYIAALNATARANWNTSLAPELSRCQVRFTQIPGGEVIDVEFIQCPYDAQGRDSVERALRKSPMPYAGFESVFQRQVTLTLCYPEEACQ